MVRGDSNGQSLLKGWVGFSGVTCGRKSEEGFLELADASKLQNIEPQTDLLLKLYFFPLGSPCRVAILGIYFSSQCGHPLLLLPFSQPCPSFSFGEKGL